MKSMAHILDSKMARAALGYAERGWHVFPLRPREKQPIIGGGFLSASTDPQQIRAWWRDTPDANLGLWPGKSGLLVIDIDGPEGEITAQSLGIKSEPTLECKTGRKEGGRHLYYRRPDFSVSNCDIGKKLDVRCDGGYVILPPSIHPSGARYEWLRDTIRELPPPALEAIRRAQSGAPRESETHNTAAREIALQESIGDGERNKTLTRYAGRLFALGATPEEAYRLVHALNADACKPPLPREEVTAIVQSIGSKEERKRALTLVENAPAEEDKPEPEDMANQQITSSHSRLNRDLSDAPIWAWRDLREVCGPMIPGDLIVVGSQTGNGKSTFLMSQMEHLAEQQRATLYLPLEVDPEICRIRWAAWRLNLAPEYVLTNDWHKLREGAKEDLAEALDSQAGNPFIHFLPPRRLRLLDLADWCRWGKEKVGASVVMIDHLHRMDPGQSVRDYRTAVTSAVRDMKDLARELGLVIICSAQLNRDSNPFDAYFPATSNRLKESAGIEEEADLILMLSRCLRRDVTKDEKDAVIQGFADARTCSRPNIMRVTCRKHRLRDSARDVHKEFFVRNGRLEDYFPHAEH